MKRRYVTVDVFTETRFGGNPLAVVLDAEGLDSAAMQAIAREFNYSETTFVLPPADAAHTAHVRIFTPVQELPFAGHPNVGTAYALARIGRLFDRDVPATLLFEEAAGLVPVRILRKGADIAGAELTAPQPLTRGSEIAVDAIAACLGLDAADVAIDRHPPLVASVGTEFVIAELRKIETLARIRPDAAAFAAHLPVDGTSKLHAYVRAGRGVLQARMFVPFGSIVEDPATGSANAALAALLADLGREQDHVFKWKIRQGVEMGRPSLLLAEAEKAAGQVGAVRIGGNCVPVMEGLLDV
jgi:trans-2,3-dihydro-3-hydroxyanthranilate isomerase